MQAANAAEAGNRAAEADAELRVGDYLYYGLGDVAPNHALAVKWYSRASAHGNKQGSYNVGWMYEYGVAGVERALCGLRDSTVVFWT